MLEMDSAGALAWIKVLRVPDATHQPQDEVGGVPSKCETQVFRRDKRHLILRRPQAVSKYAPKMPAR